MTPGDSKAARPAEPGTVATTAVRAMTVAGTGKLLPGTPPERMAPRRPSNAMRRLLLVALVLSTCAPSLGCGDDDADTAGSAADGTPFITLTEAEGIIEQGALAVVRTGGAADVSGADADPELDDAGLVDAARYESQSGREFDVLVFSSPAAARRASPSAIDVEDGESGIRAVNVLTVFPARSDEVDAYRAVARAMRRLALACDRRRSDDPQLRRACFGGAAVPPEGEGVDRDEAQDEEEPIVVDGLHYDPLIARRLNPKIAPDKALVSGLAPPGGKIWFGVFLRVCNRGEQSRTSSRRIALVDAFGQRTKPSDALPQDNPFAYRPSSVEPGRCLPREGSAAERNDGSLVLFAVSSKILSETPVALEVSDRRVILDV